MLTAALAGWSVDWEPFPSAAQFNEPVTALLREKYSRVEYNQKR